MKKFVIIFGLILFVFSAVLPATAAESLTLEEVVQLGLENNIEIKNRELDHKISKNDYEIAKRNLYPQISLESSYTRMEEGPIVSSFETLSQPPYIKPVTREGPKDNYNTSLSIRQPLYAGGRLRLGVDQAQQGRKLTKIKSEQKNAETLFQIIQSFYNLLMAKDRVAIEEDALKLVKEHKRIAQSSYEAGSAIKTDVLQAEIETSKAQQRLLEAENQLILARKRLGNLIGKSGEFTIVNPQKKPEIELELEKLYREALDNRSEIESLEINQKLTKTNLKLEQKSHFPGFSLRGNYSHQGSEFSPDEGSWNITLSGSMELYQGGKSSVKAEKIKNQLSQLESQMSNLKKMIKLEVREKLMSVEENKQNIKVQDLNLKKARENLNIQNKRFKTGVGKSVDVLNAQNTLNQTKISASQAQYKYEQSLYDLLLKTGKLNNYIKEAIINEE